MSDQPRAEDVTIRHNDLSHAPGLPLVLVVRNERPLLPEFLAHYRGLGVQRFFVLDDASTDGTPDLLMGEADVCLLQSSRRYGERPDPQSLPAALRARSDTRMIHAWRTGLMNRFCAGQWALQCDADEFLLLPEGVTLPQVIARLEAEGAAGVWGGMIDLYPRDIAALAACPESGFTWPRQPWYFDARRHFSLRADAPPRHHYEGVRHRLDVAFADKPDLSPLARAKLRFLGRRKAPSGTLVKPILQHWQPGNHYLNSHLTTLSLSARLLLPLLHYRYTPAILRKLEWALTEGGYSKGNADYQRVDRMLAEMRAQDASFLGPQSRLIRGFRDFEETGNAVWS